MLVSEAIDSTQRLAGQVIDQKDTLRWLSELDGQLAFEDYRAETWKPYTEDDLSSALLVPFPYDKLYVPHLEAMCYYSRGEYDRYENARAMRDSFIGDFRRFLQRTRDSCGRITIAQADGGSGITTVSGGDEIWRMISAYGVAVLHGYTGTAEQWLDDIDHHGRESAREAAESAREAAESAEEAYIALQLKSNPNLLDNWYFVGGGSQQGGWKFPINQRGSTVFASEGYTIDRWLLYSANSSGASLASDGLVLSAENEISGALIFDQRREDLSELAGKSVTVSVLATSLTGTFNMQCGGAYIPITAAGLTTYTIPSFDASGDFLLRIYNIGSASASEIKIAAVKVELGDAQTLAHEENGAWVLNESPDFRDELLRCQRYYQLFKYTDTPVNRMDYRPVMRSTPTRGTITVAGESLKYADAEL